MRPMVRDSKIATFHSSHMHGDVRLYYCPHHCLFRLEYELELEILFHGKPEIVGTSSTYDVTCAREVQAMVLDAIDLAVKPLKERG